MAEQTNVSYTSSAQDKQMWHSLESTSDDTGPVGLPLPPTTRQPYSQDFFCDGLLVSIGGGGLQYELINLSLIEKEDSSTTVFSSALLPICTASLLGPTSYNHMTCIDHVAQGG